MRLMIAVVLAAALGCGGTQPQEQPPPPDAGPPPTPARIQWDQPSYSGHYDTTGQTATHIMAAIVPGAYPLDGNADVTLRGARECDGAYPTCPPSLGADQWLWLRAPWLSKGSGTVTCAKWTCSIAFDAACVSYGTSANVAPWSMGIDLSVNTRSGMVTGSTTINCSSP